MRAQLILLVLLASSGCLGSTPPSVGPIGIDAPSTHLLRGATNLTIPQGAPGIHEAMLRVEAPLVLWSGGLYGDSGPDGFGWVILPVAPSPAPCSTGPDQFFMVEAPRNVLTGPAESGIIDSFGRLRQTLTPGEYVLFHWGGGDRIRIGFQTLPGSHASEESLETRPSEVRTHWSRVPFTETREGLTVRGEAGTDLSPDGFVAVLGRSSRMSIVTEGTAKAQVLAADGTGCSVDQEEREPIESPPEFYLKTHARIASAGARWTMSYELSGVRTSDSTPPPALLFHLQIAP